MSRLCARRAFTLVELVVVIAIIALVAAVSAPAFSAPRDADPLVTAGDSVVRLVERVRATALERAAPVRLTIAPRSRRWWLDTPDTSGTLRLPDGVEIRIDRERIDFVFDGMGSGQGPVLTLVHEGRYGTVAVDRWSGEVLVQRGSP